MNLTQKQIEIIKAHTPSALKGKEMRLSCILGYCQPHGANWSYNVGYVDYKGLQIVAVQLFGQIQ